MVPKLMYFRAENVNILVDNKSALSTSIEPRYMQVSLFC